MSKVTNYRVTYGENDTIMSAGAMVPVILNATAAKSVVDMGCNLGHWLSVFLENGVESIQGFDGPWTDTSKLLIPSDKFCAVDINERLPRHSRYDLALSLEVAEHLNPERAASFIEDLAQLSDIVLFSSAVPGQGGKAHVNEQWPDHWASLFKNHGYECLDFLRAMFWNDERVFFYYAQNMFLYCKRKTLDKLPRLREYHKNKEGRMPLSVIHPGLFARRMQKCHDRTFPGFLIKGIRDIFSGKSQPTAESLGLPPSAKIRI